MKSQGPLDARLWIVINRPKKSDVGGALSSGGSNYFKEHLRQSGLKVEDIRVEYLVPDIPPKNGFFFFIDNQPDRIQKHVQLLRQRIQECKPNLVLCLGAEPLYYLMGTERYHEVERSCDILFSTWL